MKTLTDTINTLNNFEMTCTLHTFHSLYGEKLGAHLFDKYLNKCNRSIVHLFKVLDIENQVILTNFINHI